MDTRYIGSMFNYVVKETDDSELKRHMISDGYLISEEDDEDAKGRIKYYEHIFSKELSLTFLASE